MIQIDMEMPEKCGLCPLFHAEHPMYCQGVKADRKKKIVAPYRDPRPEWCPIPEIQPDPDTVSRQDARMCLTGDVTDMSIEQYIEMVDKRLQQLQPSPSRPSEQHISSLETPCDHCYFFTHKCTYPGKCADRAIWEAAHEGGAV